MSFTSLFERFSGTKKSPSASSAKDPREDLAYESTGYKIVPSNWYTAKPYGFKATNRDGISSIMFLPINPNNISITTPFATNIVPTLYGTIEEHSDVKYYDIVIQGTTGIAPKYVAPFTIRGAEASDAEKSGLVVSTGRSSFPITQSVALGGFFSKTVAAIDKITNTAKDLLGKPNDDTGVFTLQSGYVAFHNLYRFLLKYKKDASGNEIGGKIGRVLGERIEHPLVFFNYKDNNQYNVAIRQFTLTRSAENPMMYNYQIVMRGYNLTTVGDKVTGGDLEKRLSDLGLDGIDSSSLLGDIKSASNNIKSIIGSALGGINTLGR